MKRAKTKLGRQLQKDFGCEAHEISDMVTHFEAMAFSLGMPTGGGFAIEPWMRSQGFDPDNIWRAALEVARSERVPLH